MKLSFLSLFFILIAGACNSQTDAQKKAKEIQKTIEATRPGSIAVSSGGWTMTATIDGKKWTASSLMPPEAAGRIIGYYKDDYISLPNFQKQYVKVGTKRQFSENMATDLSLGDDPAFYSGYNGEVEVKAINGDWIEGTFYFTATSRSNSRKIVVSDGFFRVKLVK